MLRILSIYLFSWLLLTSLSAQQGSALSLDDLLAIGLQGNQGIKIADRNLDAARASRQGSYSGLIPSVRASVNRDMDPKEIELAGGYRIKPKPYSSSMSVSQTLFDGATSWYNKRSGDNGVDRARAGFAKARNDALLNISQAYYRLLSALELLEVAEEAAALSRRQLELVEERYRLQAVRESDLLKARVNLGQREAAVYQNRSSVNDAATRLKLVIGVDPMGALEVQRDSVTIEAMPDKEVALRSMLTNNPDLQQQTLAAEGAWINAKAVRGVMLPSVGISYSGNALGPNLGDVFSMDSLTSNSATRLNISIPLFTGLRNSSNYRRARYAALAEDERLAATEMELKRQLENTYVNLEVLHSTYPINKEVLASAEADVRLAEEQYRLGAIAILDLLDAQVSLITARSSLVRTTYDIKISEAQLGALMGALTE